MVVSVTYLDDLILSFVGAPAMMLGTDVICGNTPIEIVGTQQATPFCRYKKTIICQEVAKAKNVCQVCLILFTHGAS